MSLGFLLMYLVYELVADWSDSFMAVTNGCVALDKVKVNTSSA